MVCADHGEQLENLEGQGVNTGVQANDLIEALTAQRNQAMTNAAMLAAKLTEMERELQVLRAEVEALKSPPVKE